MGTFAGNNGHRTANPAEGQPTRDEAYERVAQEFLRKFSLARDEDFAAAGSRRFREAPAKSAAERSASGLITMRRHGAKNADYRGGVTCLYDTQLLGACLHASESGGRSRPEAVRGMPDVPIAPPATGPPEGWAAVGFVSPASFNRGLWARLLRVLGS